MFVEFVVTRACWFFFRENAYEFNKISKENL